jgi:hypothetical protein
MNCAAATLRKARVKLTYLDGAVEEAVVLPWAV